MSDKNLARRTDIEVFFGGVDITEPLRKYSLSLTYTDNEEDETDDLQIKLHDREGIWREEWLNTTIQAASEQNTDEVVVQYRVIAKSGLAVHSSSDSSSKEVGTLPFGTLIDVKSVKDGWANFKYSDKTAYVSDEYLQPVYKSSDDSENSSEEEMGKGLKIQASIIRQNWKNDGVDERLECGQFELDDVSASGPPATITIKGTSLPYDKTIRQTKKSKSWENYTLAGITNEIATANGMTCMFLCSKDKSYTRVEQYRISDIAFLKKLCQDAGFLLKITNNIIVVFDEASYATKEPVRTIKHGKAGGYLKYKLSTGKNEIYTSCRVSYTTPEGELITATAYADDYDKTKEKENADEKSQCLPVYQKVTNVSEALELAKNQLRLHNKYELTATFTFPGDPELLAGCTVMLEGWGAWDKKYVIKQAKHSVSNSGYTTQVTLRRVYLYASDTADSATGTQSIDDLARAVIRGEWGNGDERRRRLTEAGYNYDDVQKRVNEMLKG